jgi:ketosteroid isomerase-like protein
MMHRRTIFACLAVLGIAVSVSACRGSGAANATGTADDGPRAAVARASTLLARKDLSLVDEFADDGDAVLIGSGPGELAIGRTQIEQQLKAIYSAPVVVRFEWRQTRSASKGDVGWVFAQGDVVITADGKDTRLPYRLTGVLERDNGVWKWRQFHGSQPVQ